MPPTGHFVGRKDPSCFCVPQVRFVLCVMHIHCYMIVQDFSTKCTYGTQKMGNPCSTHKMSHPGHKRWKLKYIINLKTVIIRHNMLLTKCNNMADLFFMSRTGHFVGRTKPCFFCVP